MAYLGIDLGSSSWRVAGIPAGQAAARPQILGQWHPRPRIDRLGAHAVRLEEPLEEHTPQPSLKQQLNGEVWMGPDPVLLARRTLGDLLRQRDRTEGVVVTVPPGWGQALRRRLVQGLAGSALALDEPLAAAQLELLRSDADRTVVVLDAGRSGVRVSVVELAEGIGRLVDHQTSAFGGDWADNRLVSWIKPQLGPRPIQGARRLRLRTALCALKEALAKRDTAYLNLMNGRRALLTQVQLTHHIRPLLDWLRGQLRSIRFRHRPRALVLVGGGARLVALRQVAETSLALRVGQARSAPEEAIALGAALAGRWAQRPMRPGGREARRSELSRRGFARASSRSSRL